MRFLTLLAPILLGRLVTSTPIEDTVSALAADQSFFRSPTYLAERAFLQSVFTPTETTADDIVKYKSHLDGTDLDTFDASTLKTVTVNPTALNITVDDTNRTMWKVSYVCGTGSGRARAVDAYYAAKYLENRGGDCVQVNPWATQMASKGYARIWVIGPNGYGEPCFVMGMLAMHTIDECLWWKDMTTQGDCIMYYFRSSKADHKLIITKGSTYVK